MDLKKLPDAVDFTRHVVPVEIRFVNGRECCEWCNLSFRNRKGHIACGLTGEEMVAPNEVIGWRCPLRGKENNG